jgi:hypothetical protein
MGKAYIIVILSAVLATQVLAQSRPSYRRSASERTMQELGRPKYQPDIVGDRAIRQDNDTLRNRLLQSPRHLAPGTRKRSD